MGARAIIITHGDVDGMVCAAQLIRRERSQSRVMFSNARWIASKLNAVCASSELPQRVYVTDIPADRQAAQAVQELSKRGVQVHWIDHHPWPDEVVPLLNAACAMVRHNAALSTPAGVLLGKWLENEDAYYGRIAGICYASEKGSEWERNWFRVLSSHVGKSNFEVLERLAYDREFTPDDLDRIKSQVRLEEESVKIAAAPPPRVERTASGKVLAVYDMRDRPGVYLGNKVFKHHPLDYCLNRISDRKWQIATNPSSALSLESLVGKHEVAGISIIAKGRPDRLLALECDIGTSPSDAGERIVRWICDCL
jgi:hypothetical protein